MAQETSGRGGPADWQKRLDSLLEHLLGLESELQDLRSDVEQLRGEARLRKYLDHVAEPAVSDSPPVAPPAAPPAPVMPAAPKPAVPPVPPSAPSTLPTTPPVAPPTRPQTTPPQAPPTTPPVTPPTASPPPAPPPIKPPVKPAPAAFVPSAKSAPVESPAQDDASFARGISQLEAKIGGAWLSRLGAAAILVGAIFVFKIAIDQGWITPWMRVAGGWGVALVLLVLGEVTSRRQMPWFAASVTGAGLGLGYIASYSASPQFYNLMSTPASYGVFSVVTFLGLLQAVRLAQLTTALFALAGGYLTLLLLRTAHPTAAGLLGYLIALNLGALGAGQLRRWPILRYLTWPCTAIMIALYLASNHVPGTELAACLSLLPALFVMFQSDIFVWRLRQPDEKPIAASALSSLNSAAILAAVWVVVSPEQVDRIVGTAFFAVAAFQTILARALWVLSSTEPNRNMSIGLYSQASTAAAIGFPVAFDRSVIVLGWSAQALTIVWLVRHVKSVLLRAKVPLLLAAGIAYITWFFYAPYMMTGPAVLGLHLVQRMWLAAGLAVAGAVAAWLFARWYARSTWWLERSLGELCAALAAGSAVIAGATLVALEPQSVHWVWTIAGVSLCLGLLSYKARVLRLPGLMIPALAVAVSLIIHDINSSPLPTFLAQPWHVGPITFGDLLPAGLALAVLAFWNAWLLRAAPTTRHFGPDLAEWVAGVATVGVCVVLWHQLGDDNPAYGVLAGTVAALALTAAAWRWTVPAFNAWSAVTWSVAAIYWATVATIGQRNDTIQHVSGAWTAATPFLNATFASALGLIAAAWPIAGRLKTFGAQAALRTVPMLLAAYIVIHALSFEVDRWFQIHGTAHFPRPEYIETTTLTALWAAVGLTYVGAGLWLAKKPLRLFGLVVLGVAAAKMLWWDTIILRMGERHGTPWFWTTMYPLANPTFLGALLICIAAWIEWRLRKADPDTLPSVRAWLQIVPAYTLLHVFSFEVDRWFQAYGHSRFAQPPYVESTTLTAVWAAFVLVYLLTSLRFRLAPLWWMSLLIAGISTVKLLAADTMIRRFGEGGGVDDIWKSVTAFANPTMLAAVLLAIVAFIALAALKRVPWVGADQRQFLESLLPTAAAYMLTQVLSFEVDRWFQMAGLARFSDPAHAERVALSVLWACCALGCVVGGLTFSIRALRLFGLLVFAVTAGKVLFRDMAHVAPVYRALSAMGLGVLALAGSFAYQRVRRLSLDKNAPSEAAPSGRG